MAILKTVKTLNELMRQHGKDSSSSAKKEVFKMKGLDRRLGRYVGSSVQINALTKSLKNNPIQNLGYTNPDPLEQAELQKLGQPKPITPSPQTAPIGSAARTQQLIQESTLAATKAAEVAGLPAFRPGAEIVGGKVVPTTAGQDTLKAAGAPVVPPQVPPEIPVVPPEGGGQFDLTQIPTPPTPTAADILSKARGKTAVQIAEQEAEIGKERLTAALPGQLSAIRAKFASRGLFFSGARTVEETDARNQALANELNIDIRFSKILGNAIDKAETELGKDIEEVIEDAKDQRKAEVDFLADIGLAVDPQTGDLYPTLQAQRDMLAAEREERLLRGEERAIEKAAKSFETRTIGDRIVRFEFDADGNVVSQTDLGPSGAAGFTKGEQNALTFDKIATSASRQLEINIGEDGFFDPDIFMNFRNQIKLQTPTFLDDFDRKFAQDLNPVDAKQLGITQDDLDIIDQLRREAGLK